ncbi:hypothetical protein [Acinetobacter baumannii]|uniref:hypothetical protein n=1 Tax=Acinetobacter baumannii TaxID=470 RepID=UPI001901ADF6|nr:hypothetical protein [Acinetobacter baumannii]MBJ9578057.1 hypothetical protein [Acinetobacter baumannii]
MSLSSNVLKYLEKLEKSFKVLSQNYTLKDQLFDYGWYPIRFVSRVEKDSNESIDAYMERLILDKYDQIKEYCFELFPLRREIIEEAFKLFEAENYIACIPLFLMQTDGIARDYGTKGMFSGKINVEPNKSKFIPYVNKLANQDLTKAIFIRFFHSDKFISSKSYEELPISINTDNTTPNDNYSMNRHGILHGLIEYQNYGTKLNALRAICFMVYTINLGEDVKFISKSNIDIDH